MNLEPKILRKLPWYYNLGHAYYNRFYYGGGFLFNILSRLHLLNKYGYFPITDTEQIAVPLNLVGFGLHHRLRVYEQNAIMAFAQAIDALPEPPILIDCGADIGLYSRLLMTRTRRLSRIIAFEPNPRTFEVLEHNLHDCPIEAAAYNAAVADFNGFCTLEEPDYDDTEHSRFIRPAESGTPVWRIDDLGLPSEAGLAIKIDVEGAELAVLTGAAEALQQAPHFVVQFEAHPEVFARNGIDPVQCLRMLAGIGEIGCLACLKFDRARHRGVSLETGFFNQLPPGRGYDVIATHPAFIADRIDDAIAG
jgi:FkbM family methyltransferase